MKLSFPSKEYVSFDERGHKKIKPKPFLRPAMEMAIEKIFKKNGRGKKRGGNMGKKIDEIERKILKEYPERYYKIKPDSYGNVVITDVLNTEPVCLIYGRYHPYAADLILESLRKGYQEKRNEKLKLKEAER